MRELELPKDEAEGVIWFRKAAEKGSVHAKEALRALVKQKSNN